eukprot:gene26164-32699_t
MRSVLVVLPIAILFDQDRPMSLDCRHGSLKCVVKMESRKSQCITTTVMDINRLVCQLSNLKSNMTHSLQCPSKRWRFLSLTDRNKLSFKEEELEDVDNGLCQLEQLFSLEMSQLYQLPQPNEAEILGLSGGGQRPKVEEKEDLKASDNSLASYYAQQRANEDSDSDDVPDETDDVDKDGCEIWPPTQYDALAPLSLPLGPKTANMRVMLAAESILADPHDIEALEKEESSSLFLIQMPSDLNFNHILESRRQEGDERKVSENDVQVKNGRLGKLQLLKSGKVRLVTDCGKSYEVSSGMAASFAQYLTSIQLNEVAPEVKSTEPSATGGANGAVKPATASNSTGQKKK